MEVLSSESVTDPDLTLCSKLRMIFLREEQAEYKDERWYRKRGAKESTINRQENPNRQYEEKKNKGLEMGAEEQKISLSIGTFSQEVW